MCGIVAALPTYPEGVVAARPFDLTGLPRPGVGAWSLADLDAAAVRDRVAALTSGIATFRSTVEAPAHAAWLAQDATARGGLVRDVESLAAWAAGLTGELALVSTWSVEGVQGVQIALRALSDAIWALQFDVLSLIETATALAGPAPTPTTLVSYLAVLRVLASINRLEVRGRDSAGISILVSVDPQDAAVFDGVPARDDLLLRDGSRVLVDAGAVFTYKHAAVVGRLGDNVDALLSSIRRDTALHRALACRSARVTVLAHTRWASVGRISEPNAHPVDSRDADGESPGPYTIAALNGDIDNYLGLRTVPGQVLPPVEITTDAKIIPLVVAKTLTRRAGAAAVAEAVAPFEGSMAIALVSAGLPDAVQLVVKGSGQGLYVGLADSGLYVASEVYGLVGVTDRYLRVDGGRAGGARNLGSVLELSRGSSDGSAGAVDRFDGDGTPWPVGAQETSVAEVTSRDLALGDEEHYLAKEIKEAAASFEKTLLGRIRTSADGSLEATLAAESYPDEIRRLVESGGLDRIIVTGQGTAAVAARGIAYLAERVLGGRIVVSAAPATELSISGLSRDMSRTLVVAISQSGSTTDTNRCVDLAKERGASVISILNRRDSDLAAKSAGVIYTSDGRDIEMAVASTKAFYSQVAAGCLLALRVARSAGTVSAAAGDRLLRSLQQLPDQLRQVGQGTDSIAAVAAEVACTYPSWAVVGSGPNSVAASEVRIKLSELCYKTVSVDAIEDKKHIDLSAEALVVALVAGAQPNHLADLAKEIEIFGAHRNRPVVVADEGTEHLWPVGSTITVPRTRPELAWILSTAAGHLFSYHMARAIDAAGEPLREALDVLEAAVDGRMPTPYASSRRITTLIQTVLARAGRGELRGVLTSDVALELARVITTSGDAAPDATDATRRALTAAIDQLTRSIDTVKHQAKTVTVGTSRSDADVFDSALALALEAVDADTHALSLQTLRAVSAFSGVVRGTTGATRYRVNGPMIEVVAKTGSAALLRSRADEPTLVVGSKRRALEAGEARLVRGRSDGRIVVIVPEVSVSDHGSVGLTVLHVELDADATVPAVIGAMSHMGDRWAELRAAASETSPSFDEKALAGHAIEDLLFMPVEDLAARLES
ncbi:SIS domain-containing protein [Cellulomonas sp. McL0617]|uniref:SIS domain-containing protein n=1 Tax=Cellulomonas sp. McL0617 TaxID=3415675 RepID=UPI003CE86061